MALDRTTLHATPKIDRRPAVLKKVQRAMAANAKSSAGSLQERLGNRATQLLISRTVASAKECAATHPVVTTAQIPYIQCSKTTRLPVSKPTDPAELEAEETAKTIVRETPALAPTVQKGQGTVQRAEARSTAPPVPSSTRINIAGGSPLPTTVRNDMEPRFGASFSNVRIHTGEFAAQRSAALNADAFTVGEHIFFGRDQFQPQTEGGRELIAHELTHTIQQGAVAQSVQRAEKKKGNAGTEKDADAAGAGVITGNKLEIPELHLPVEANKSTGGNPPIAKTDFKLPKQATVGTDQRDKWKDEVKVNDSVVNKLLDEKDKHKGVEHPPAKVKVFYLQVGKMNMFLVGTRESLRPRLRLPNWSADKKGEYFQVDHITEKQLGGKHDKSNFQLLEAKANMSSGSQIEKEIRKRVNIAVKPHVGKGKQWEKPPSAEAVRQQMQVVFKNVVPDSSMKLAGRPKNLWTSADAMAGKHLDALEVLSAEQAKKHGLLVDPTELKVYISEAASKPRRLKWQPTKEPTESFNRENWDGLKGFTLRSISYTPGKAGKLQATVWDKGNRHLLKKDFPVDLIEDAPYSVRISQSSIRASLRQLQAKHSLVDVVQSELDEDGIVIRGVIHLSLPILKNGDIDIAIEGNDVTFSKTFASSDIQLPGPIEVTQGEITVAAGTRGLAITGELDFEIQRVGKGKLIGKASTREGYSIAGTFDFDTSLFKPATVHVEYTNGKFSGSGELGIPAGKVRGIKSAYLKVAIADDVIDAKGSVKPDIPAVEQADLSFHYSKEGGMVIAGDLALKKNLPGISDGSVHAEVTKKGDLWSVSARGQATPKVPGVSAKLLVAYEDGAFDAVVTAAYAKGMLAGMVVLGVTNRAVGDDGKPGAPPAGKADKFILYGGGQVGLKLAPWLQATAGIKFKPNGEVEVTGKIGVPSAITLFNEKKFDKNLFKIGIDIPILGFSVLGHRVGIFLDIGGGLDLSAGVGPGQLRDVNVMVVYNPAHEEQTNVHGHAALHIPAHAGLRLFVKAALGAGIPIVSAEAGIELGGQLGIEGAAHAEVDVDWTPKKGLILDAKAEISAEPKFKFDITGFVLVEADLLLKTVTLYEKRWQLVAMEYGSGLKLGMRLPIHYEEGKAFAVSLSDIEFDVPRIDAKDVLGGVLKKIV
jgi:Domain of unknown function (DUF4157)